MRFFRKTYKENVSAPDLEEVLAREEKRLEQAGREFHKKKSICGMTALELLLDGLKSGKLKREEI